MTGRPARTVYDLIGEEGFRRLIRACFHQAAAFMINRGTFGGMEARRRPSPPGEA